MSRPTLHAFDVESFLAEDWQQRPRLLRNALDAALFPLTPEELAGLACEPEIESRLIRGSYASGFEICHGPFDDDAFNALPEQDWTLLVQAVDHLLPEVAAILEHFRFIPNWRIDDVMVSYAPPGGSAGPHYDHYDVFLIQGRGSRRWQVGERISADFPVQPHADLRLIDGFTASSEWTLQPGDILYLPAGFAHWGISDSDDCMTYSVGFRAPSTAELLSEFCDRAIAELTDFERYRDLDLNAQANPGEIAADVIERVRDMILQPLNDSEKLARWFGQHMTQPKYDCDYTATEDQEEISADEFLHELRQQPALLRDAASRFAYTTYSDRHYLFVDGVQYTLEAAQQPFIEQLCANTQWPIATVEDWLQHPRQCEVVLALFSRGSLYFEDEFQDC